MTINAAQSVKPFRFPIQQGRFPLRGDNEERFTKRISSKEGRFEYVYDVYKLPEGFRAEFSFGVFGYEDVDKLSDRVKSAFPGKELRLVKLSELEGEFYSYEKATGERRPMLAKDTYILLVEDPEFKNTPEANLARIMFEATQKLNT